MLIAGFFIEKEEIEKLRIFEDVLMEDEVLPYNSCTHLEINCYKEKSPKYCPECGKNVKIHPGQPAIYVKVLTRYHKDFFHPKNVAVSNCNCQYGCKNCEYNCERTKYLKFNVTCLKCEEKKENCECSLSTLPRGLEFLESAPAKPYPDLSNPSIYQLTTYYYKNPYCDDDNYKNYFVLTNGEKLVFVEGKYGTADIFCIYYEIGYNIAINEKMLAFKSKLEEFLKQYDIPTRFEVRPIERD